MGDGSELNRFMATPRHRRELVEWLREYPQRTDWQDDDWRIRCENEFPVTACARLALAGDRTWPSLRWQEALQAWSEGKLLKRSWRYMAPVLVEAPDHALRPLAHGAARWLRNVAQTFDRHEGFFFDLCRSLLALDYELERDEDIEDPVTQAINHPVGVVTEALLSWWTRSPLEDGQDLPSRLSAIFAGLCDVKVGKFRHGRLLLAARVLTLFRVDPDWTEQNLLPLFDWNEHQRAARAAWKGYLWSPRLHRPLMERVKKPFLDTAFHYGILGRHGPRYAALLTYATLDRGDTFLNRQLADATRALPGEGLREAAQALSQALESAGEQRTEHWANRTLPYLRSIWPNSIDSRSPAVSESLAKLCIAAQEAFPEAVAELRHWLQPVQYPGHLLRRLNASGICSKHPKSALEFLALVTSEEPPWGRDLEECVKQIQSNASDLENDSRFQELVERLRSSGAELD